MVDSKCANQFRRRGLTTRATGLSRSGLGPAVAVPTAVGGFRGGFDKSPEGAVSRKNSSSIDTAVKNVVVSLTRRRNAAASRPEVEGFPSEAPAALKLSAVFGVEHS